MRCSQTKLASPYVDHELTPAEKEQFEAHAAGCADCAARVKAFRDMHAAFAASGRAPAPAWFAAQVRARAGAAEQRAKVPLLVRFAEAAVVLLMIVVGIVSGGYLMNSVPLQGPGNGAALFSLDLFEPAPPDSVGGVYLAMTEADHAK